MEEEFNTEEKTMLFESLKFIVMKLNCDDKWKRVSMDTQRLDEIIENLKASKEETKPYANEFAKDEKQGGESK